MAHSAAAFGDTMLVYGGYALADGQGLPHFLSHFLLFLSCLFQETLPEVFYVWFLVCGFLFFLVCGLRFYGFVA